MAKTEEYKILVTADTRKATQGLKGITAGMKALGVVAAAAVFVKIGKEIIDASKKMQTYANQLKLVTKDQADLERVMARLTQASIQNRTSFAATAELFTKLAVTTTELGVSEDQLLNVTGKLSQALAVAGADAGTTNGVIRQFGQAMASGTVRGDEFNSIVEGLGPALAIMAKESGLNVGELRKLSQAGGLTADVLFDMLDKSNALSASFNSMSITTEQLETQLGDSLTVFLANAKITSVYDSVLKSVTRTLDQFSGRQGAVANMTNETLLTYQDTAAALEELKKRQNEVIVGSYGYGDTTAIDAMIASVEERLVVETELAAKNKAAMEAETERSKAVNALIGSQLKLAKTYKNDSLDKFLTSNEKLNIAYNKATDDINALIVAQGELGLSTLESHDEFVRLDIAIENATKAQKFYKAQLDEVALAEAKANIEKQQAAELTKQNNALTYLNIKNSVELSKQHSDAQKALIDKLQTIKDITSAEFDGAINGIEALHLREAAEAKYNDDIKQYSNDRIEASRNEEAEKLKLFLEAQEKKKEALIAARQQELVLQGRSTKEAKTYAEFENKTNAEKSQFAIGQAKDTFQALGQFNKQAFAAYKAFAIAQAIQNTYLGASQALRMYPPPFSFIAAAAQVAAGLAQVAQIRNQNYSGREFGGPVTGGSSFMVGENGPEIFTPQGNGSVTPNHELGGNKEVNVNFTINAVDAQGIDEIIVSRRGLITNIIREATETSGVRSAF